MQCRREADFPETSAMRESEFLDFFNFRVRKVNLLEWVTTVTSMCTYDRKTLGERKHRNSCGAETAKG